MKRNVNILLIWLSLVLCLSLVLSACAKETTPATTQPAVTNPSVTTSAPTAATFTPTMPATTTKPAATPAATKVIKWKMSSWNPIAPVFGHYNPYVMINWVGKGWADWVGEMSNGLLQIDYLPPGSVYAATEALQNIGAGVIECDFTSSGYAGGVAPETLIAGNMPMCWTTAALGYDAYYQLGLYDIMAEVYAEHNVVHIPTLEQCPGNLAVMFDASTLSSVKGKKIRVYGAMSKFIESIGGLPVSMSYADSYMGMKLGTVEGATVTANALEDIKLKEVAKGFVLSPTIINPCDAIIMNQNAFKALPADLQKAILRDSKYYMAAASFMVNQSIYWIASDAAKNYGVKLYSWSDADTKLARQIAREKVWPDFAKANARCAKMVDIIVKQLIEYQLLDK
ncbi:MAG: hypothetical protein PHR43_04605 [Dehalococcoidales bacterium]|nr:hypothetical protein [Dehalococcoidales bacterium]